MSQAAAMDHMYRFTRHIYDLSRKYYLLGRDQLLKEMKLNPEAHVLEVGCGTARNLIKLAKCYPKVQLYGLDASEQMLTTAQKKIEQAGYANRIHMRQGLAEELDAAQIFERHDSFDAIFFSYSLSIIPTWRESIEAALKNLQPDGVIYIVDFWDQKGWPTWFQKFLRHWLKRFHVCYKPELLDYLRALEKQGSGQFHLHSYAKRYAYLAEFKKAPLLS